MSVNFAGARSVDDRRRRRISQTKETAVAPVKSSRQQQRGMIPKALVSSPELLPESPVHALIPKTPWKFWTLLALVFCIWSGFAAAGICYELIPQMNDWGLARIFNLHSGTFWNCWTISCLMVSAQLSWVTYWYRSHGTDDFQGHYKTWLWTSIACCAVAFLMTTEIGYIFAEQFGRRVHLFNQQMTGLIWLAALYAVGYELARKIDQELGDCRSAFIFMVLFVASSIVGGWLLLMQESRLLQMHQRAWLTLAHSLVASFLFATIFCFTRRTLYITAEAAERRKSPVFRFALSIPYLIKNALFQSLGVIKSFGVWACSWFKRKPIEAETPDKKPKRIAKKPLQKAKKTAVTKRRKLRDTVDEQIEDSAIEAQDEATEDDYETDTSDVESYDESSDEAYEESDSEESAQAKFDEEAWLKQEIEREAQLKKQAELERQKQQQSQSGKQKFRLDNSHPQPAKSPPKFVEEYNEPEEVKPQAQEYSQEAYNQQQEDDEDGQNGDGNGGFDPELFKGLSKREKRKLKQQLREQERQQGKR